VALVAGMEWECITAWFTVRQEAGGTTEQEPEGGLNAYILSCGERTLEVFAMLSEGRFSYYKTPKDGRE
jgi:hypothetical protein